MKPHKPVSSSTLGRWIKTVMTDSGIDTSLFKPHSVRGASTSALYQRGASLARGGEWFFKNSGSRKILVEFHGSRSLVF